MEVSKMILSNQRNTFWRPVILLLAVVLVWLPFIVAAEADNQASQPDIEKITQMRNSEVKALKNMEMQQLSERMQPVQALRNRLNNRVHKPSSIRPVIDNPFNIGSVDPLQARSTRDIISGSGFMSLANLNSFYFNFETGMNGNDTVGMDVMISGNEWLNFGSERHIIWGTPPDTMFEFANPSLLHYLSPDSSIATVDSVPMVELTDPPSWTHISWDWQGGNNGGYLEVGNVWVVYTRTTHCYAVLEVTAANPDSGWFAFDYLYQPDGSNSFGGGSMPGGLDIQVNGADADTIVQGEDIILTIDFSTGSNSVDMQIWIDMDGDGILDPNVDMAIDDSQHFLDNDYEDEDRTFGRYQITFYGGEDGPNQVGNLGILFEVMDMGGYDVAFEYIAPMNSPYSVSGTITPPIANIIVIAANLDSMMDDRDDDDMAMWMTLTDSLGNYQNFLPSVGNYAIMAEDFLNVTDGMYADTSYFDIYVDCHLTGYDFNFITPTAAIDGYVEDENGMGIEGIYVWADEDWGDGPGRGAETDTNGYYFMNVEESDYRVGLDSWDLIPDFLVPRDSIIYVPDYDTVGLDFDVYSTDSYISGTVYLNDQPFGGALVSAKSWLGWTETPSGPDGYYELSVSSLADTMGGYHIDIWNWDELPPGTVQLNWYHNVMSGSDTIDIYLATFAGGIEGHVFDDMGNPIWAWIHVYNDFEGFGTGTDHEGYYYLPLPNGAYQMMVGSDGFYTTYDSIYVMDGFIYQDFWLQPMTIDGSISGFVYNENDGSPLEGAVVQIGNDFHWDETYTDPSGYYYFDVPYGVYWGWAWKDGFAEVGPDSALVVNPLMPDIQYDYYLHPFTVDASIGGVVVDGEFQTPIGGANVHLQGNFFGIDEVTGPDGHFYFEVPSDTYWLDAWAPGYHHTDQYEVFVETDSSQWVVIELWPQESMPPMLHSVEDVPNDQGRQVRLVWSPGNPPAGQNWTHFSVWRQVDEWLWDFIAVIPYHGDMEYAYVAPTLVDSNHATSPTGEYWSTFMVSGHAYEPWEFYDSNWMDGYSVDDLTPHVPVGVMAFAHNDGGIALKWQPVPDADFEYFAIYRGLSAGFEPGEAYDYTIDTAFVDIEAGIGETYYYLISATDFNGNESDYSAEVSMTLLSADDVVALPEQFEFAQNYPNPFNPATTIEYALPEAGQVTIKVYNLLGVEVATLINDFMAAGRYDIHWQAGDLASGVYLVQMRSSDFTQTRKVMLMK